MRIYLLITIQLLANLAFAQKYHANEDFNNSTLPLNWTNDSVSGSHFWSFGIDGANMHSGNQNLDGTPMAFFDDDVLGSSSINNTAELSTPIFDNSSDPITYLSFDYNFRNVYGQTDTFYVDVFDGSQWQRVFSSDQDDCGNYTTCSTLPSAFIDISAFTATNCQVRFTYHDGNNWGYYVGLDNVKIWSPYANDLLIAEVIAPESSCNLSATDSIKVLIKNAGYQRQQNFDIAFELNGNSAVIETITDSLAYQDSLFYTFSKTGDFSTVGLHDLKVYTKLINDSSRTNDTINIQISNDTAHQLNYFNDFETANNSWTASGTNASWAWGIPNGNVIDTAYSGQNAWVTNLNGNYNSSELSYLTSPCFDFSNSGDPRLSFKLIYQTEINYDQLWMEYSLDNGTTWVKLLTGGLSPQNWYNNSTNQYWDGSSNAWLSVENVLIGLGGEPQVKFRFVFDTDGSSQYEGVGVDYFNIIKPQTIDLSLNEMLYPSPTTTPLCGYGTNENIILEIENKGANAVDTFIVAYKVDNLPPIKDTVTTTLLPNTLINYTHSVKANLSGIKTYYLTVWVEALNDGFTPNDTLFNQAVSNSSSVTAGTLPYSESFETFFAIGSINGQNGWTSAPLNFNFGWKANSGTTASFATGPSGDHTSGNGIYAYLESSGTGQNAVMESPCIDLSQQIGANLTFWYHRYGSTMQPTYVDVYNGSSWVNVDVITAQPQTRESDPWTFHQINISAFAGRRIKVRFRGTSQSCCFGDMAIDDIRIERAKIQLKNLTKNISCEMEDQLGVEVKLYNKSIINVSAGEYVFTYTVNGQHTVHDTLKQPLAANDSINFTFKDSINLSQFVEYVDIQIMGSHINPNIPLNDTVHTAFHQPFVNKNFKEDFESYRLGNLNTALWDFGVHWTLLNDSINNNSALKNKTFNGSQYINSTETDTHLVSLESACINTRNTDSLDLVFWYNIQGTASSKLYIYDKNDTTETIIDSIMGSTSAGQWQRKHINLNAYLDSTFVVGFRFIDINKNQRTSISLDDIQLLEQKSPYDARTNAVKVSLDSCDYSSKTISIRLENMGLDQIPANAVEVNYQIDQNASVRDTIPQSIAAGDVYTHDFSTSADFSQIGNTYQLKSWTNLNGDLLNDNDSLQTTFTNHTKVDSLFEDFENFTDYACLSNFKDEFENGWHSPNNSWGVHDAANCSPYPLSGPFNDHTSLNGQFVYIEPTYNLNKIAELHSPCVDISNVSEPVLSYWYHLYGSDIDTFKVELYMNGQWVTVDSLIGQQQTYSAAPWRQKTIRLNNFKSASPLQFRFSSKINGRFNRLALDDISIADSLLISVPQWKQSAASYKLYPNPSEGLFTLAVDQSFLGEVYHIRELSGKVVQEGKINSTKNSIQLNENAKGIYFLSIPNRNVREKVVVY